MNSFKMSAFIWSSGNQLQVLTLCTKKAVILVYPKSYCGMFDPRCLNFIGTERLAFFSYYSCPMCFAVRNETKYQNWSILASIDTFRIQISDSRGY